MSDIAYAKSPTGSVRAKALAGDDGPSGGLIYSTNAVPLGGFSFSSVNGGFNFDMPLASVAMFNTQALDFVGKNSVANRGFVDQNVKSSQALVAGGQKQLFGFLNKGIDRIYSLGKSGQQMQLDANLYAQDASIRRAEINVQNTQAANSGGGWCFITTAICELDQLPDDCYELQTFRKFRDEFMRSEPELSAMVDDYYSQAPKICARLGQLPDKGAAVYARLKTDFLYPALRYIENGDNESAMHVYRQMVVTADRLSRGGNV
jgi:hypothetical protein